jgi:hypothetical protein
MKAPVARKGGWLPRPHEARLYYVWNLQCSHLPSGVNRMFSAFASRRNPDDNNLAISVGWDNFSETETLGLS